MCSLPRFNCLLCLAISLTLSVVAAEPPADENSAAPAVEIDVTSIAPRFQPFLTEHCLACHASDSPEADLDLSLSLVEMPEAQQLEHWIAIYDRVNEGEMPPDGDIDQATRQGFTDALRPLLLSVDRRLGLEQGRAVWRRMNRMEYENTLRDLLSAPWLQIQPMLPADGEAYLYNKVGTALDTSHVQIARYLAAAESALRSVVARSVNPPDSSSRRFYARDQGSYKGKLRYSVFNRSPERAVFPLLDHEVDHAVLDDESAPSSLADKDPTRREREAFGVVAGSYEPLEVRFSDFEALAEWTLQIELQCLYLLGRSGPGQSLVATGSRRRLARASPRAVEYLFTFTTAFSPQAGQL